MTSLSGETILSLTDKSESFMVQPSEQQDTTAAASGSSLAATDDKMNLRPKKMTPPNSKCLVDETLGEKKVLNFHHSPVSDDESKDNDRKLQREAMIRPFRGVTLPGAVSVQSSGDGCQRANMTEYDDEQQQEQPEEAPPTESAIMPPTVGSTESEKMFTIMAEAQTVQDTVDQVATIVVAVDDDNNNAATKEGRRSKRQWSILFGMLMIVSIIALLVSLSASATRKDNKQEKKTNNNDVLDASSHGTSSSGPPQSTPSTTSFLQQKPTLQIAQERGTIRCYHGNFAFSVELVSMFCWVI